MTGRLQMDDDDKKMTPNKSKGFRIALITFSATFFLLLFNQGVLENLTLGGLAILLVAFSAIAYLLYRYIAGAPDYFEEPFDPRK